MRDENTVVLDSSLRSEWHIDASTCSALTKAYAVSINDNTLKQSVNYSESDLFYNRDITIQLNVQDIYNIANKHIVALATYSVTQIVK